MELVWYKQQREELGGKGFSGTHGTTNELTVSQKERESRGEGIVRERGRDAAEGHETAWCCQQCSWAVQSPGHRSDLETINYHFIVLFVFGG